MDIVKRNGKVQTYDRQKLIRHYKQLLAPHSFDTILGTKKNPDYEALANKVESYLAKGSSALDVDRANVRAASEMIDVDPIFYDRIAVVFLLELIYKEVLASHRHYGGLEIYKKGIRPSDLRKDVNNYRTISKELFDYNQSPFYKEPAVQFEQAPVDFVAGYERDLLFDYLGLSTLYDRYLLRSKETGQIVELPQQYWYRVAVGLDATPLESGTHNYSWVQNLYDRFSLFEFCSSTPTLFHSNTKHSQLASCFVQTVDDDLGAIFKSIGDSAQMAKYTGGIGISFSSVRGTGAHINTTGVESQGIIPWIGVLNASTHAINRSGKRHGAAAVYLEPWHFDIYDFLDLRKNTGDHRRRAHDLHLGLWINDLFMYRVENDMDWTLFSPDECPELTETYGAEFNGHYLKYELKALNGDLNIYKVVKAKELWRQIVMTVFEQGEPYICFKDASNFRSPQRGQGIIHSSNLCSEITLNNNTSETATCNLGSINLTNHFDADQPFGIDRVKLQRTVETAIDALDNVIDLNFYPVKESRNSNRKYRPIGLGVMGFADHLFKLKVEFDSEEAENISRYIHESIADFAMIYQAGRGKVYPMFEGSTWSEDKSQVDLALDLLDERERLYGIMPDPDLYEKLSRSRGKWTGMKTNNSNVTAIAPTATISNISGAYPSIEAPYKNVYAKENTSGLFTVYNHYLVADLKERGLWNSSIANLIIHVKGDLDKIEDFPDDIRRLYRTSYQMDMMKVIRQNALRGAFVDQSISFNLFYNGSSGKYLSDAYFLAWKLGVKTLYYCRTVSATESEASHDREVSLNIYDHLLDASSGTKLCKIDDPDCESCQ